MKSILKKVNDFLPVLKNEQILSNGRISFILFILLIVNCISLLLKQTYPLNFGFENEQIASSIVAGKGFSNPFLSCETGPTAWMPPFWVLINAFFFYFFKKGVLSFVLINIVQSGCIALGFYFALKSLRFIAKMWYTRYLLLLILIYFLFIQRYSLAFVNGDVGLYILSTGIAVLLLSQLLFEKRMHPAFYLYLFLQPLATPPLVLSTVVTITVIFFNTLLPYVIQKKALFILDKQFWVPVKTFVLIILPIFISTAIWSVRNYYAFHEFVPTKSNIWYEFYLANISSPDGIVYRSTSVLVHPFDNSSVCQSIVISGGETKWLKKYKEIGKDYINKNKRDYLLKTTRRIINALVWTGNQLDIIYSPLLTKLNSTDISLLEEQNIIRHSSWTSLHSPENKVIDILRLTNPENSNLLINDWKTKRAELNAYNYSFKSIFKGLMLAGIPFLCMLIMTLFDRKNTFIRYIFIFFISYLFTYILVLHTWRQQNMLIIINSLAISLFIEWIVRLYMKRFEDLRMS